MRSCLVCALALLAIGVASLDATTVQPPSFQRLLADAEAIVVSEVMDRVTRWERVGARDLIVTRVTLRIHDVLKGQSDAVRSIRVLGGTIGDRTLRVPGAPLFLAGDRDVLFLTARAGAVSPIVGLSHGRFRIVTGHNGSGDFIANDARQPVASLVDFARPQRLAAGQLPLTLTQFLREIRSALAR
jgi:hypothetical protein